MYMFVIAKMNSDKLLFKHISPFWLAGGDPFSEGLPIHPTFHNNNTGVKKKKKKHSLCLRRFRRAEPLWLLSREQEIFKTDLENEKKYILGFGFYARALYAHSRSLLRVMLASRK